MNYPLLASLHDWMSRESHYAILKVLMTLHALLCLWLLISAIRWQIRHREGKNASRSLAFPAIASAVSGTLLFIASGLPIIVNVTSFDLIEPNGQIDTLALIMTVAVLLPLVCAAGFVKRFHQIANLSAMIAIADLLSLAGPYFLYFFPVA